MSRHTDLQDKYCGDCRYGTSCHRPDCYFQHESPELRCQNFAKIWSDMLSEFTGQQSTDSADSRHGNVAPIDVEALRQDLAVQDDQLQISVQAIEDLKRQMSSFCEHMGSDCSFAYQSASTVHDRLDTMNADISDLSDLSAQKYVELKDTMQSGLSGLRDKLQKTMSTFSESIDDKLENAIDRKLTEIAGTTILGALRAALEGAMPIIEKRFEVIEQHINLKIDEGDG